MIGRYYGWRTPFRMTVWLLIVSIVRGFAGFGVLRKGLKVILMLTGVLNDR